MVVPVNVRELLVQAAVRFILANRLPERERRVLKKDRECELEDLWDGFLEEWGGAAGSAWNEALKRLEKSGEIVPQRELEG